MASIKLILRVNQKDQAGHSPLYIRIIKDRKTKFITAGTKLKESEWDEGKQRVKKNYPNSARMNANLAKKVADAEAELADLERKVKTISVKRIKEAIKGKEVPNFFDYAYNRVEKNKCNLSVSSYRGYKIYLGKFEKYTKTRDVFFDDITVSLLLDYMSHMGNELGNGNTTQRYSIMILAIMFKDAIKEEIIPDYMYPFNKLKLKKDKSKRQFLKKDQIEKIANAELKEGSNTCIARDMFLFSIYAGGLRFSDVVEFQVKHFNQEESRIKKVIRKTGRLHQFKIGKVALDIIQKYKKEKPDPEDFIFPIIKFGQQFLSNADYRFDITSRTNKAANFQIQK
jgi:site-specific recombinase XerD